MEDAHALDHVRSSLWPIRKQLVEHELYQHVKTLADLRIFMEHHVFAVWDFMSLLKALQLRLTCVAIPWVPQGSPLSRRLINEMVLEEESDQENVGTYISHFELYRAAMEQCGADISLINVFLDSIYQGKGICEALKTAGVPQAAQVFVETTWKIIESGSIHAIAAAFTLGREDPIPHMFRVLVATHYKHFPGQLSFFRHYLERHIHLDEERHTPMAFQVLTELCNNDSRKWREVEETARIALNARIALWNAVVEQIASQSGG